MTRAMPFTPGPRQLGMVLTALDLDRWLWPDDSLEAALARRRQLIDERLREVHAMLPSSEAAAVETRDMVADWLRARAPRRAAAIDRDDPLPLRAAGRVVQEDLCVMQRREDGAYALTAAILCFPSHWRLADKIGRPLRAIHAPVPGFEERLAGPVDRFFATLTVERPVWRANWSVVETDEPFQPGDRGPVPGLDRGNAGERLYLRVERQTLRRLPRTGAVLFTIRTLIDPLAEAVGAVEAAAMAERLRAMEPGMGAYKGMPMIGDALLDWLDRRAGVGA